MKLSLQLTLYVSIAFAMLCLAYAAFGLHEMGAMPLGQERDDARGFAYFWMFLGGVGLAVAFVSWRMLRQGER